MNLETYLRYVAAFNGRDWERAFGQFCTPDVRLTFPVATLSGQAEAVAWYTEKHRTIFETLLPRTIRFDQHGALVDLTVRFVLAAPTDRTPLGEPGEAGDVITVPMRARYTFGEQGLITSITVEFTAAPRREPKITTEGVQV